MAELIDAEETKLKDEPQEDRKAKEIDGEAEEATLGSVLLSRWEAWKDIRQAQEDQWLINLRQFHSQYEPDIITKIKAGRSDAYVGITRMKVFAAYSRLIDILFPVTGNKHWKIKPTPKPTMAETDTNQGTVDTGIPGATQVNKPENPEDIAAKGMTRTISDHLLESDYDLLFMESLLESVILGTGCMKAASTNIEREFEWILTEDGWNWTPAESESIKPQIEGPSIFDTYPDPNAASMKSGIGCFQRHVLNKHEFRKLKSYAGFKPDAIDDFIENNPRGNHNDLVHETERKKLAFITQTDEGILYDALEYWGYIDGIDLREVGVDIPDERLNEEFLANVWTSGSKVIKAVLDKSVEDEIPFYFFPYEKVAKRIFGKGVPEICSDSQDILNAAARRLLDDVALLGPQIEVNISELTPESQKNIDEVFAFKVWARFGGDTQNPLMRVHNVTSVSRELVEIINIFRRFIDEETNLPTAFSGIDQGGSAVHETAQGLSMLMGASNIISRSTVKNIDKYGISPFIKKLYMFFMQWSDDEEIKGDMKIEAQGSVTLIAKEVQTTQLINALNITNNPADLELTKRDNMLRKVMENQGIDPNEVVRNKEEIEALSRNPVKQQLDELAIQKALLENEEMSAKIETQQAEINKINAAIANDAELLRLKRVELKGKQIEAAEQIRIQKAELLKEEETTKSEKVAGKKKTTVGATRKRVKNDGLQTNNP